MNSLKTLSFTTLAALATAIPANAFFSGGFNIFKQYRQYNKDAPTFIYGNANMFAGDGTFTVTATCAANGTPVDFPPNPMMGCNIGANGVQVTYDSDGNLFPLAYWEVIGVEPASTFTVGYPDQVRLVARPVSDYPMDDEVDSLSSSLFYDLDSITGDIREYRFGTYGTSRDYFSRKQMEKEIVEGVYQFRFPLINQPTKPLYLNFPVKNTVEGYVKEPIKQGFRFTNLRYNAEGFAQYDWRLPNVFTWEGLTASHVLATDRLFVGFRSLGIGDTSDAAGGGYIFPPGVRARLPSPVQSTYTLPPGFFTPLFPAYTKAVLELSLERGVSTGITISSTRVFQLPIIFVNSFAGSMAASFPEGTSSSALAKDADPDGDGISNWVEWVSGTDPAKANAPTTLSAMSFVPPSMAKDGEPTSGYWQMTLPKASALPEGEVNTVIESSTDLKTWVSLEGDPQWKVIPEESQYRVISTTPGLVGKRYFRARHVYTAQQ